MQCGTCYAKITHTGLNYINKAVVKVNILSAS